MARTLLLSLVVTVLLVFAITDASRGQTNQVNGQKIQNRGTTRYHSESTTESSNVSVSTTRSPRDKNPRAGAASDLAKHETDLARESSIKTRLKTPDGSAVLSRTNVNRHANLSTDNVRNRPTSHAQARTKEITRGRHGDNKENVPESQTPKRQPATRRASSETSTVWVDDAKLDPEVYTKSPGHSRSRTGRKIHPNLNGRESKTQAVPPRKISTEQPQTIADKTESPKSESEKVEAPMGHPRIIENVTRANASRETDTKSVNGSSDHKDERDVVLSGSESVRVDVPLTVGLDEDANSNLLGSSTISSSNASSRQTSRPINEKAESNDISRSSGKKSRHSDRSKSRARSNTNDPNFDVINLGSAARRGTSKFGGTATAETSGRSSNSRHRSGSKGTRTKSRNRSAHKSKSVAAETKGSRSRGADIDFETNGRTEKRRPSSNDRRTSDKRRSNDRSKAAETRGRSRTANGFDGTTASIPKATTAETTSVSSVGTEITTFSSTFVTTRASTTAPRASSSERTSRNKGRDRGESGRSKKPPKEDFFNHGLGFRGRKSSTEGSFSNADLRTTTAKSETQLRGNPGWTLRRRPSHVNHDAPSITSTSINRDQANEIILPNDTPMSTDTPLGNAQSGRRGTKRPKTKDESNTVSGIAAKGVTRGSKTFNKSESHVLPKKLETESDNYPPAFRARLNQLKNTNVKPTGAKSTTRTHLQATKPSAGTFFSERSKMKLDLARRLIKPELNVDENVYDVTTTPYSDKSKAKEVTAVSESRNVEKTTKATKANGVRIPHGSLITDNEEKEKSRARARWKFLENRKSLKDRNLEVSPRSPIITSRKSRVTTEKTSTPLSTGRTSTKSAIKISTVPSAIMVLHRGTTEETAATTSDANVMETLDNNIVTTIESIKLNKISNETPVLDKQGSKDAYDAQKRATTVLTDTSITDASESKTYTTEFPQEVTLSPTVTTFKSTRPLMTATSAKVYPVYIPDTRTYEYDLTENRERIKVSDDTAKSAFRPRYAKQEQSDKVAVSMVVSRTVGPTSRYIRKKTGAFTPFDAIPKASQSTEPTQTQTKRREFRPRTATYRRHSEVPTSQLIQQTTAAKEKTTDITITPKPTKFHSQVTPSIRSSPTEPFVSVTIDTSNDTMPIVSPPSITESNNTASNGSNIFSPTKSTFLSTNTTTLLEQLRSTVAPLLNTLGDKTPVFSGAYSNVDSGNSAPRITPNGSPPRFSARYKGAELFVRKPSSGQAVVPSITTSSTTASTPLENSGLAPPVDINSPSEPRFVTFYQALESASIRNENLVADDVSQQQQTLTGGVTKVDSNATVPNGASNDTANNNDTATSPNATITTTSSPDTTVDTTTIAAQPANVSLSSRLGTENTPNGTPETASTTVETPADTTPLNVNMNDTKPAPTSESPGTTSDNTITSTPISANVLGTSEPSPTETTLTSTSVDLETSSIPSSTESISSDVRFTEQSVGTSTATTEMAFIVETVNTDVSTPAFQNLEISTNMDSFFTFSPSPESFTITQITPEITTVPATNNAFEDIEINTVQQSDETTPPTTNAPINGISENVVANTERQPDLTIPQTIESSTIQNNNIVEDIETNNVQQSDTTIPSQITETTSTTELTTTGRISNDITQTQTTQAPTVTSTFRTRLIDYAQDILSRLRGDLPSTRSPNQNPITATAVLPASPPTTTQSPARIQETTTVQEIGSGNIQTTTTQLTLEVQEMTTQNTVGLDPDPSAEQRLSTNVNVERNATLNSDSMMTTTQDTRSLGDSPVDARVAATTSMPSSRFNFATESDPSSSSNDTLLTELMTIAKTLFSEAMNDTRQSSFVPSQISDFEATTVPDVSNLSRANNRIENADKNEVASSNDTSERTTASSALPTSLESITENIKVTMSVDLSGNETGENSNRASTVGSEISLIDFNMRPTDVKSPVDIGDVTAMPQISLSQIKIETPDTITPASMNFELTTNTPDSQPSNPTEPTDNNIGQRNTLAIDLAQNPSTTLPNNNIELTVDFTTNNPVMTSVTANTAETLDVRVSTNISVEMGLTTSVAITEVNVTQISDTNQAMEPTTVKSASDPTNDQFLVTNVPSITTMLPIVSDDNAAATRDTQPFSTEPPRITESIRNLVNSIETTTNQFNDITSNAPQMITDLISETPNLIARFQDTTTATTTAQRTAGSSIIQPQQTTETTTIPSQTASMPTISPTSPESFIDTTTTPSPSVQTTTATTTTTETTTTTTAIPQTTSIRLSSQADFTTTTASSMPETTTPTIDINENLISTEATTNTPTTQGTTVTPSEADDLNTISRMDVGQMPTTTMTTSTAPPTTTVASMNTSTVPTTTTSTTQAAMSNGTTRPTFAPVNTAPSFGRFGPNQSQMIPTSRTSSSRAPLRDYLIYGIYPNKTIVRKRPEDNLIDPRNVDSPYVIFGIYPDGRLVRKFPNGTIIPDSPRNPVEVVFTLSTTTTTNRPVPRPFNQANQAVTYNQYQAPVYYNNRRPVDELTAGGQNPSPIDFGLTGNAIGVPPGVGPNFAGPFGPPASVPTTNKMSDMLLNTQMGTLPNAASTIGNVQMSNTNNVRPQGPIGSIVQDRDMKEAARTSVTSDQRSSVYIGQDKFINYQINGAPNVNPQVVDVKINSMATSVNEGKASSTASISSFENLLNNQSGSNGIITAPPGFPWRDPLDQIFGITTSSPIQTASVASNQLDEPPENNASVMGARPINPQVEIFTPTRSGAIRPANNGPTTTSLPLTTASTTPTTINATGSVTIPSSTTTAATTTTTTTTTITTTTTSTTTPAPTSTTGQPTTMRSATSSIAPSTTARLATTASSITAKAPVPRATSSPNAILSASDVLNGLQANTKENAFGTTFDDLAFLNSLLQNNVQPTTPKTLSGVEQMLANRILALALAKPGPTRSPKAIQDASLNVNLNSIKKDLPTSEPPPSEPIIIDLLPYSSSSSSTPRSSATPATTKGPVVITAKPKTTARPKTSTTQPPVGFGMGLWRALFGNNFFDATTATSGKPKPTIKTTTLRPVQATQRPVEITQKPVQAVKSTTYASHIMSAVPSKSPPSYTTRRSVDIADIQVASTASFADSIGSASASTPSSISSTPSSVSSTPSSISSTTLLNNPNPRLTNDIPTSTYSPEDDAKFLAALLRAIQTESQTSTSTTTQRAITDDDEAFLRAILSQQPNILSATATSSSEANPAALLALLLKQQGIEPSTPATNLREQLRLASLDLATQLQPDPAVTITRPTTTTTTTNRPIFSTQSAVSTNTRKVTAKPSPRSRPQTTTWSPSSTYPPPLFGQNSGSGLATATRVFGQFLGAAISGAAQQLQTLLRNGTRNVIG